MDENLKKEHQRQYTYHFFFAHGILEELKDVEDFINSTEKFLSHNLQINRKLSSKEEEINPRFHPEVQF